MRALRLRLKRPPGARVVPRVWRHLGSAKSAACRHAVGSSAKILHRFAPASGQDFGSMGEAALNTGTPQNLSPWKILAVRSIMEKVAVRSTPGGGGYIVCSRVNCACARARLHVSPSARQLEAALTVRLAAERRVLVLHLGEAAAARLRAR